MELKPLLAGSLPCHYESSAAVGAPADQVFEYVDNHASLVRSYGQTFAEDGWEPDGNFAR